MEFFNEDYEAIVNDLKDSCSIEDIDKELKNYPESKRALAALITLIQRQKRNGTSVDDWECDMSEIVWPEVVAQLRKNRKTKEEIQQ